MPAIPSPEPVFRFAPSPNGELHLGHALSAFLNRDMAQRAGGRLLLRIEDIDRDRCRPEFEAGIMRDLAWLGIGWEQPVRRQSEHLPAYRAALEQLSENGLVYPAFLTRGEVKARVADHEARGGKWPRDPDGSPHYPGEDRLLDAAERRRRIAGGMRHAWRLDMAAALKHLDRPLCWADTGDGPTGTISADPAAWGDVVLWRSDAPSSYHLSVTVDDALQAVSHVVRGLDLFAATAVHRLLQELLGLPQPRYHHHRLILGEDGRKLSKSAGATGIRQLAEAGSSPADIRRLAGL